MIDRRVLRTRKLLQQGLVSVLENKSFEAIEIQDITDSATLNRATFYLHYDNKQHLLLATLEEIYDELVQSLENDPRCCIDSERAACAIFTHVQSHAALYRVLMSDKSGVLSANVKTKNYIALVVFQQLSALVQSQTEWNGIPLDFIAHHVAGAMLGAIGWWLENNMPYSPEVMARMCNRLSTPNILLGLGLGFDKGSF